VDDEVALVLPKTLGREELRFPEFSSYGKKNYVNTVKANKYLSKQNARIIKAISNKEVSRAIKI